MKVELNCVVKQIKIKATVKIFTIKAKIGKIITIAEKETTNLVWQSTNW